MSQLASKSSVSSFNHINPTHSSNKLQLKLPYDNNKPASNHTTKLPPINLTPSNQNHSSQLIFLKPKFPINSGSLHVGSTPGKVRGLNNYKEDEIGNSVLTNRKGKTENDERTTHLGRSFLSSFHSTPINNNLSHYVNSNSNENLKEIKNKNYEINNDVSSYNKIVKDLENIIEHANYPKSLKNARSGLFETPLSIKPNIHEPKKKISPVKKIMSNLPSNKNSNNKLLSPLNIKTPLQQDQVSTLALTTSLLFNPNQLLGQEYLPILDSSKSSTKKNGIVKAYAANTHQGLIRNYNEDRVAIILNIMKPPSKKDINWPLCSYFAIYDGHGGTKCAEFLRDNLHHYVIKDSNFPSNPKLAIKRGFQLAEKNFIEIAQKNGNLEKSGSCGNVVLIVDDMCYVANVGDSRAVMSQERGSKIIPLSKDHKPEEEDEKKRILEAGGQVYQSQSQVLNIQSNNGQTTRTISGPFRVLPGRLSVARTFGDAEAKLKNYGGNPNVIIAEPDIKSFKLTENHDFIIIGCDGIFDKLTNKEIIKSVWETANIHKCKNIHDFSGKAVENVMKESLIHKTLDNITVVMIAFKNLKETIFDKNNGKDQVDKNGNLIIDKLELVEYTYFPDNPNEPSSYEDDNINKENKTNIQSKDKLFNKTIKRKEDKN